MQSVTWRVRLQGLLRTAAFVIAFLSVATLADQLHWLLELFTHFRLQYLAAAIVLGITFVLLRERPWAVAMIVVAATNGFFIAPYYLPAAAQIDSGLEPLTIVHANVQGHRNDPQEFLDWLHSQLPDLVFVQEVDDRWADALRSIANDYPHQRLVLRADNFGIAVASRLPFSAAHIIGESQGDPPSLLVDLTIADRQVTILSSHPPPPIGQKMTVARNVQLKDLAVRMRSISGPKILIGDLNITMWAHHFDLLLDDTGFRNARRGFGIIPSWPTFFPIAMIPIDHCLVSRGLTVMNIHSGPNIGSDHLPIVVEVALQN